MCADECAVLAPREAAGASRWADRHAGRARGTPARRPSDATTDSASMAERVDLARLGEFIEMSRARTRNRSVSRRRARAVGAN